MRVEPGQMLLVPGERIIHLPTAAFATFLEYTPRHPQFVAWVRYDGWSITGVKPFELEQYHPENISASAWALRKQRALTPLPKGWRWLEADDVFTRLDQVYIQGTLYGLLESETLDHLIGQKVGDYTSYLPRRKVAAGAMPTVFSGRAPQNPSIGQVWLQASVLNPRSYVWDGAEWKDITSARGEPEKPADVKAPDPSVPHPISRPRRIDLDA